MATSSSIIFHILFLLSLATTVISSTHSDPANVNDRKVYIVYMGALPDHNDYFPTSHHENILQDVLEGSLVQDSLVRSYKRSFNGFAAKLTEKEAQRLRDMDNVISVFPSRTLHLLTSRSWEFTGLKETAERNSTVESNIVVGLLDSGIWPESESFNDEGFGPPPKKWKGACEGGTNFTCNNKLIGARYYTLDNTTRDTEGHGTHTASTAAGSAVKGASFYGVAEGTARGAVPSARIAMYKICSNTCSDKDILSAFDDAIADGVDIISISVGSDSPVEFYDDSIAIGSFHAMQKGILTSHSMGNNGPSPQTGGSGAPWLFSVAASSMDRRVISKVVLGSGISFEGTAVNAFTMNGTMFPLVYGEDVSGQCDFESARLCIDSCLDSSRVEGKIVVCDSEGRAAFSVLSAGAAGVIFVSEIDVAFSYILPASVLSVQDGDKVKAFIKSSENPTAVIFKSERVNDSHAPVVASFSSRGPNILVPDIIKPDITAPGVDILAAWSPVVAPTELPADTRAPKYNILSGTSMSCPHVSGAAAYVKTFHPEWSPSAIKSALMTTGDKNLTSMSCPASYIIDRTDESISAWFMNATNNAEGEFAYGAGHIDPVKALNPGLVYEADQDDYMRFLCNIGFNSRQVRYLTNSTHSGCPTEPEGTAKDLNYPSMGALVNASSSFEVKFPRTVTNVGLRNSTYKATVTSSNKVKISVTPNVLSFKSLGEKKSFVVSVAGDVSEDNVMESSSLVWSDGVHSVRSPIVVYTKPNL